VFSSIELIDFIIVAWIVYCIDLVCISFQSSVAYINGLLGQNSNENHQPVMVQEAPLPNKVPKDFENYSSSKCFFLCFTLIDNMMIALLIH